MPAKRIPSSFTSKAITEGEYIAGASGSKLSATKLPASMSAPAASTSKAGRSNSRANGSKSVAKVHSDEPTVLLGVVDMPVPKGPVKGTKAGGNSIARVDSSAPTALVAPADYVHMYKAGGPPKVVGGGGAPKNKVAGKGAGDALNAVPSEAPTALIAPNDYEVSGLGNKSLFRTLE